jgi:acetolactate synthase-1/2/3 large subunit
MKASDAIARLLAAHRARYCFELIGGMITHLVDSIAALDATRIITMHHEQGAAFAAEGAARASWGRELAVALATSGPGAANLLTGVGSCWFDSVPVLFITGQVNTGELKGDLPIRQQGFQEMDIVAMARPVTKLALQVESPQTLLRDLDRAIRVMREGRPGPVLVDIPNDVQRAEIPDAAVAEFLARVEQPAAPAPVAAADLDRLRGLCATARRPLICLGGGARWAGRLDEWTARLDACGVPYISTLMGHERVKAGPACFNMIGAYGNREANWAVQNCDLLLVVGSRLDVRQTGADARDFARRAKIVHVDVDPGQLDNRIRHDLALVAGAEEFLTAFTPGRDTFPALDPAWLPTLQKAARLADVDDYAEWPISPTRLFRGINEAFAGIAVDYVCDVGNHQMWAAHGLRIGPRQAAHYSGGMGAMGFALPAAIGIALQGGRPALVLTGDGSLQINIQELDTLARLQLDVRIVVMNNTSLGMVKNFQDLYFEGRDQSTRTGYSAPDFVRVAQAYNIEATRVAEPGELESALQALKGRRGPFLLELMMSYATECRPRLAFGCKLDEQLPVLEGWNALAGNLRVA